MKKTLLLLTLVAAGLAHAESTISSTNRHAWAANLGWIDFRPERPSPGDGFRFGEFSCSGYLWSPNIGWIDCGDGTPADGVSYANQDGSDFGVNHYGTGDLYGLAWAPNAGWINFGWATLDPGNPNRPRVNLVTGEFTGLVWSANGGWINLGGGQLKTISMQIADSDGDGISDAFEITYAGGLTTMNTGTDLDHDGMTDKAEYIAATNPLDPGDALKIIRTTKLTDVSAVEIEWTSRPARVYAVEAKTNLVSGAWQFLGEMQGSPGSTTRTAVEQGVPQAFFRVSARLPLQP